MAEAPSDVENSCLTCIVLGLADRFVHLSAIGHFSLVPVHFSFPIPVAVQCCLQPRTSDAKCYRWKRKR